jgi:hypothetical protein
MLIDVSSNQMHMLGCLTSAIDSQQPQASYCFVFLPSRMYTGRFRVGWPWQVTVSSDHFWGAEAAYDQLCVVGKKDSYFSRVGVHGSPGARRSSMARAALFPLPQIPVRLSSTLPMLRAPEIAGCGADCARESGTPCAQVRRQLLIYASGIV